MQFPVLDPTLCRARQKRLQDWLSAEDLEAALLVGRNYVHALTGYWHEQILTPAAVLVETSGLATVVAPSDSLDLPAADRHVPYQPLRLGTQVENIESEMSAAIAPLLRNFSRVGGNLLVGALLCDSANWVDISAGYQYLRRKKDPDEVGFLRLAIRGAEAAYAETRRILKPGLTELELYASMQAAAIREVGDPLSGWGNDFQIGALGSYPRRKPAEAGGLAILDVGVGVRGYRSDLCRTFSVDGSISEEQAAANEFLVGVLSRVEEALKPGCSCHGLFEEARETLDGWNGYSFKHHLGHGIGLDPHEVPRLNPEWDDVLQPGDCVAIEPGLYGPALREGMRLEHNYLITETGFERLSSFPLDL